MNKGDLMNQVYQSDLTKRATLVMLYLINRADKEMTCFPGIKTIARECGISSRTVQRALNDLEEAGFVKKESRYHEQGGQRSNLYTLLISVEIYDQSNTDVTFETYVDKFERISDELEEIDDKNSTNKSLHHRKDAEKVVGNFIELKKVMFNKVVKKQSLQQYCHGG